MIFLKFPVARPDYRCDWIKIGERGGKKTRDLQEGNGRNQRGEKMRADTDGSTSQILCDVLFLCTGLPCVLTVNTGMFLPLISTLGDNHRVTRQGHVLHRVAPENTVM